MKSLNLEEENIIKDIRNLFRLKKELNYTVIEYIINLLGIEEETKAIKDTILTDIENLFKHKEEENYYKPVRVSNLWSNNYIGYERNGDKNETLSVEEYLNKIRSYLKEPDTCKLQLLIVNNFIFSIVNDEWCLKHSKSDNIEIR